MRDAALASRLAAFEIDEGSPTLSFADRLARENLWSSAHARRVVAEYLRFVYLAAISPEIVTPSIAVDQAWHLHLCYTRSYWHELCREVLGRELHHGPTRGGGTERIRYHEAYERTLALYAAEFGHPAPADIWPSARECFSPDASPLAVAPRDYLLLPKRTLRRVALAAFTVPLAALAAGALATSARIPAPMIVLFVVGFGAMLLIGAWQRRKKSDRNRDQNSGCGSACGGGGGGHSSRSDSDSGHSGCGSGGDSGGDSGCGGGCGGGD